MTTSTTPIPVEATKLLVVLATTDSPLPSNVKFAGYKVHIDTVAGVAVAEQTGTTTTFTFPLPPDGDYLITVTNLAADGTTIGEPAQLTTTLAHAVPATFAAVSSISVSGVA